MAETNAQRAKRKRAEARAAREEPAVEEESGDAEASDEETQVASSVPLNIATRRGVRDEAVRTGGSGLPGDGTNLEDGELTAEQVEERSLGDSWNRAFNYARSRGNGNKSSALWADSHFDKFEDSDVPTGK